MQNPKQQYLFNYMDVEYDDMESDDYDEAYASYLLDHIDDDTTDDQSFEQFHQKRRPTFCEDAFPRSNNKYN